MTKKPTGYWRHYHSRCWPLAPMEPGVHTMSNELILQISCNILLAFKWIFMMRSGHNISHIWKLSYGFMCEIITWSDDKTKLIHKNISVRIWLQMKIPITIVKAQTPSNPIQKSRVVGRWQALNLSLCIWCTIPTYWATSCIIVKCILHVQDWFWFRAISFSMLTSVAAIANIPDVLLQSFQQQHINEKCCNKYPISSKKDSK